VACSRENFTILKINRYHFPALTDTYAFETGQPAETFLHKGRLFNCLNIYTNVRIPKITQGFGLHATDVDNAIHTSSTYL
jgi:hypothetical protein